MLARALTFYFLATPLVGQVASWTQLSPATSPIPASEQALAHDVGRGVTVLYGANRSSQTWEWNGTAWVMRAGGGPSGTDYHQMVYDSGRNLLVMVHAASGFLQTWEWTGTAWTQRTTTTSPPTRNSFALAFDAGRGVTVLFGGSVGGDDLSDTWEYDGTNWTQRASGGPSGRYQAAMAYDAARSQVVLFGGRRDNSPAVLGDTWVWNGTGWIELFGVVGPLPRQAHAMAYDSDRQRIVLFGGFAPVGPVRGQYDDTWEWDGSAWALQTTAARPGPGPDWSMAYSPSRQKMDLFGGPGQTWEYRNLPAVTPIFTTFGAGCQGTGGVPQLTNLPGSLPVLGQPFRTRLTPISSSFLVIPFGILGASSTTYAGLPLPIDLSIIQATGCSLLVSIDLVFPLTKEGSSAIWTLPIPNLSTLLGKSIHQQALVLDPGANPLGAITSNAGTATVGT